MTAPIGCRPRNIQVMVRLERRLKQDHVATFGPYSFGWQHEVIAVPPHAPHAKRTRGGAHGLKVHRKQIARPPAWGKEKPAIQQACTVLVPIPSK
jgi:hypothetical protein